MTITGGGRANRVRVAVVGAGFSGLAMAYRLRREGIEDFVVLERTERVGGTWRENTYPGCQCDVPSHLYSLSFAPNPDWSRTYSLQPEIQEYLERVAVDQDLLRFIRFGVDVTELAWDDTAQLWRLQTSDGEITAQIVVGGLGGLDEPCIPELPGLESFEGPVFHSARWDHSVELAGKRVAVIGTGASAVQIIPRIQPEVSQLHVYQRTPTWIMPHSDRPVTEREKRLYRRFPALQRLVRAAVYWSHETRAIAFCKEPRLTVLGEKVARMHLRRQVSDPSLRAKLTPSYRLGCKRVTMSNTYFPALSSGNCNVITEGIREVRPGSVVAGDGVSRDVDVIVLGTGFNVHSRSAYEQVRGRGGRSLAELWHGGPNAYLGSMVPGFPNFFLLLGPNSGTGHTSVVVVAEAQAGLVLRCLRALVAAGGRSIEVRPEAHATYQADLHRRHQRTVWSTGGCRSWYLDADGRNRVIYPDFSSEFVRRARRWDPAAYEISGGASVNGRPAADQAAAR